MNGFQLSTIIKDNQKVQNNYYQILGVNRNSSIQQICLKYRDIALANHPSLIHQNINLAYRKFAQAAQAFDVLFDPEKRSIYDQYGQEKLKQGVLKDGNLIGKYKFTSDPQEVFQKFFGTKNVYDHLLQVQKGKGLSHPIFKAQYQLTNENYQVPNLVVPIQCTLTQLYNGCTKNLNYQKKVLTSDGKNSQIVIQNKTIVIQPGSSSEQPLVYPGQGNSQPGYSPSFLIFKLIEVNEKNYKRKGDNLIYTANITLMQALDSKPLSFQDLKGQVVNLHFDQIISPQTTRLLQSRGMPIKGKVGHFGDLIVKFNIQFPEELNFQKKQKVIALLRQAQRSI